MNTPFIACVEGNQFKLAKLFVADIEGIDCQVDRRQILCHPCHRCVVARLLTRQTGRNIEIFQAHAETTAVAPDSRRECQVAIRLLRHQGRGPVAAVLAYAKFDLCKLLAEQVQHLRLQIALEGQVFSKGRRHPDARTLRGRSRRSQFGKPRPDPFDIDISGAHVECETGPRQRWRRLANAHCGTQKAHLAAFQAPLHARGQCLPKADVQIVFDAGPWQRCLGQSQRHGIGRRLAQRRRQVDGDAGKVRFDRDATGLLAGIDDRLPGGTTADRRKRRIGEPGAQTGHRQIAARRQSDRAIAARRPRQDELAAQRLATDAAQGKTRLREGEDAVDLRELRQILVEQQVVVDDLELPGHPRLLDLIDRQRYLQIEFTATAGTNGVGESVKQAINRAVVNELQKRLGRTIGCALNVEHKPGRIEVGNTRIDRAEFGGPDVAGSIAMKFQGTTIENHLALDVVDARPAARIEETRIADLQPDAKTATLRVVIRKVAQVSLQVEISFVDPSFLDRGLHP